MNLKLWLACGALVCMLSGCSGDVDGITGTATEPNTMGKGESSSSGLLMSSSEILASSGAELSSSSIKDMSSSSAKSSSSSSGIHVPPPKGCKPSPLVKQATYGVMDAFIAKRVTALEEQGLENAAAKDSATEELFRELGLDTLFYDSTMFGYLPGFSDYMVEYTLYYLYKHPLYSDELSPKLVDDFADGVLEPENYCIDSIPYASLDGLPFEYLPLGCIYSEDEVALPLAILRNIWRKCAAMPYCDKSVGDTVITIGKDHFVCENGSWVTLEMQGKELNGTLCTENGAKISSNGIHVCHEGFWYDIDQSAFMPAEYFFNPDFEYGTFTDSRDGHVYKTTVYNGQTWLAQDIDYYDSSDTLFVNQSLCAKVVEKSAKDPRYNRKQHPSENEYCDGASRFYTVNVSKKVCPDGWRLPTKDDLKEFTEKDGDEWRAFAKKIFVRIMSDDSDSDIFGLSLRTDGLVEPYGGRMSLSPYNIFWLEEGVYVRNGIFESDVSGAFSDSRENGEFVAVRCIKK
ncbi:MAG: hypothetical protein II565_00075 [Fibrobacter sp.]|nr:hypothetical protein [Fibrobacter sp.]